MEFYPVTLLKDLGIISFSSVSKGVFLLHLTQRQQSLNRTG